MKGCCPKAERPGSPVDRVPLMGHLHLQSANLLVTAFACCLLLFIVLLWTLSAEYQCFVE